MLKRVIHLCVASSLCLVFAGCSNGGDDNETFGSFTTIPTSTTFPTTTTATATATDTMAETTTDTDDGTMGDGDGDMSTTDPSTTDPSTTDPSTTDPSTTDDTSCPPGDFGCPCDNGACAPGLECIDGECQLPDPGTSTTTTTTSTGGGGNDPWDPNTCAPPSEVVSITDIEGSLCSAPCVSDIDCPAGPVATTPACALILEGAMDPTNCALICDRLNDTCSPGSTCKAVPNQPGVGICTYP